MHVTGLAASRPSADPASSLQEPFKANTRSRCESPEPHGIASTLNSCVDLRGSNEQHCRPFSHVDIEPKHSRSNDTSQSAAVLGTALTKLKHLTHPNRGPHVQAVPDLPFRLVPRSW